MHLHQPGDLVLREALVGEVRQRRPTPENQRATQVIRRLAGVTRGEGRPSVGEPAFEAVPVELGRLEAQRVAAAGGPDRLRAAGQLLAERGDAVLQDFPGSLRRALTPELVDNHVARQSLVAVQEQEREDCPLSRPAQRQAAFAVEHLQGPEDAVVHRG